MLKLGELRHIGQALTQRRLHARHTADLPQAGARLHEHCRALRGSQTEQADSGRQERRKSEPSHRGAIYHGVVGGGKRLIALRELAWLDREA